MGPLFHPLWVRSIGFLSPGSSYAESADFAQVLVGAAAVLFDVLVCLSVCLSACHALRDILMALHEVCVGELFVLCVLYASDVLRMVCWSDQYHASDPYRILVHVAVLLW